MSRLTSAAVFMLLSAAVARGQAVQWTIAEGGSGHFYQVVAVGGSISWTDAQARAASSGGYLATITSIEENDFAYSLALANVMAWEPTGVAFRHGPWLGGLQIPGSNEPGGGWEWVTGEPFVFTNWDAGEPNDWSGGEDRLQFHGLQAAIVGGWNDLIDSGHDSTCDCNQVFGFVVEYDSAPIPAVSTIGLVVLVCGLMAAGGHLLRRRRVVA